MIRSVLCAVTPVLALLLASCAGPSKTTTPEAMVLGSVDRTFMAKPEYRAFADTYDTCTVSPDVVELIRMAEGDAEFLVFFGSWCGDSKREVPKFLKIADMAGIPAARMHLIGIDRAKKSPDGAAAPWAIERVPTFIVLRNGKETGRIVEHPVGTLEGDLLNILAGTGGH